jgi:pyocin large subunit-like protein
MYFEKGKFMKSKILALFLALTVGLTLMLSGCGDSKQSADTSSSSVSSAQVTSSEGNKKKDSSEDDFYQPRDQAPQGNFDGEVSSGDKKNNNKNSELRFRNQKLLDQHYEKHGREMGFKSAKEYEAAAVKVVNNPKALHKLESDQDKGNTVYYIEKTNEFVVVSADGFIRTYFNPSGGKAYYDRQ